MTCKNINPKPLIFYYDNTLKYFYGQITSLLTPHLVHITSIGSIKQLQSMKLLYNVPIT